MMRESGRATLLAFALSAFGLSGLWNRAVLADTRDAAHSSARIERFLKAAASRSRITRVDSAFLIEGEQRVWHERSEETACYGYFAVGLGDVRDVDLALHAQGGQALDEDLGASPYAYARACVAQGTSFSVSAALYAGRGELLLFRLTDAPKNLGLLPHDLPLAVAAGGRLEPTRDIGHGPDGPSISTQFVREERVLADAGYVSAGPASTIEVRASVGLGPLSLSAGHCYRVLAQVPAVTGVMLEVVSPDGSKVEGRAPNADHASVAICPEISGDHVVRVLVRPFRALSVVRAFEHPLAQAEAGGNASLILRAAEARHAMTERALAPSLLGEAWVEPALPSSFGFSAEAHRCYGVSAVSADEVAGVDIRLLDPDGRLLARNEGREKMPVVVHCPERSGVYRFVVLARGRAQRVLSLLGTERSKEKSP